MGVPLHNRDGKANKIQNLVDVLQNPAPAESFIPTQTLPHGISNPIEMN